jgi:hypothetical protein
MENTISLAWMWCCGDCCESVPDQPGTNARFCFDCTIGSRHFVARMAKFIPSRCSETVLMSRIMGLMAAAIITAAVVWVFLIIVT